ncbi:MAG: Uma2 family endonuclease, partial [Gemmataceae bacterium]
MEARQMLAEELHYRREAQKYLAGLTDEDFMESTSQATQRRITLASLELVERQVPRFHLFNELLVQYPVVGQRPTGKVVPDNMVVLHDGWLRVDGSYDVPFQPAGPFWAMEYVSRSSERKDYDINLEKYEHALRVPYYLLFHPDVQEMTLYRMNEADKYVSVKPNEHGRYALPEVEIEVALVSDWVRFWFRGELLPLPGELLTDLRATRQALEQERRALEQERQG